MEHKKYAWLVVKQNGSIGIVEQDEIELRLEDLRKAVHGHIEIVAAQYLCMRNPFLRLVVDDNGLYKNYGVNALASAYYGQTIVGDVAVVTIWNPDPTACPDIYALTYPEAVRLQAALSEVADRLKQGFGTESPKPERRKKNERER